MVKCKIFTEAECNDRKDFEEAISTWVDKTWNILHAMQTIDSTGHLIVTFVFAK